MALTEPTSAKPRRADADKSMKDLVLELKDLTIAYAKQETLDPLRALGTYVMWGLIGAILLAVGTVIGALAVIRALQAETTLTGHLSWIPYLGGIIFTAIIAAIAWTKTGRSK